MKISSVINFGCAGRMGAKLALGVIVLGLLQVVHAAQIRLNWDDNSTDETGFKIERTVAGGGFTQIATVGADVVTFVDTDVSSGIVYGYRVKAYNAVGDSPYSNAVTNQVGVMTIAITAQPASPSPVSTGGYTAFTVAANGSPAPAIQWQVSTNSGTSWTNLSNAAPYSGVTSATLALTGIPASFDKYQYRAVFTNGLSTVASNAAVLNIVPVAPYNVQASKVVEPSS